MPIFLSIPSLDSLDLFILLEENSLVCFKPVAKKHTGQHCSSQRMLFIQQRNREYSSCRWSQVEWQRQQYLYKNLFFVYEVCGCAYRGVAGGKKCIFFILQGILILNLFVLECWILGEGYWVTLGILFVWLKDVHVLRRLILVMFKLVGVC